MNLREGAIDPNWETIEVDISCMDCGRRQTGRRQYVPVERRRVTKQERMRLPAEVCPVCGSLAIMLNGVEGSQRYPEGYEPMDMSERCPNCYRVAPPALESGICADCLTAMR